MVLHICHHMEDAPGFGSVVLNKVLYYSDHTVFVQSGKTISGFTYIKQENGPTPQPSEFLPLRSALESAGQLKIVPKTYFGRIQKRPYALRPANVSVFSPEEVEAMDGVIEVFKSANAKLASDVSHMEFGWELAKIGETLPTFTYLLTEGEINDADTAWALESIREYESGVR